MAIDPKILAECTEAVRTCEDRKRRSQTVDYYAQLLGMSRTHLRRRLSAQGISFGYKRRSDAGTNRHGEKAAAADIVANMIIASHGDMPTYLAIDTCKAAGKISPDIDLPAYYVDRYMRAKGIDRKPSSGPAQSRKIKWGEVGEVLQIDSTNCAQWFFVEDDGRIRFTETGEVYRNKPAKHPPIIRYVASDPVSGCFRVKYFLADGESAEVTLQFLHWAMTPAEHTDIMPMGGVPKILVMDKGPGNKSSAVSNVCEQLGIEPRKHKAGHSWAKGSVESTMYVWQRAFESKLRLYPASSIDELNERAYKANLEFCATRVMRKHDLSRSQSYAAGIAERGIQLPPPWEIFLEAATTARAQRTIKGGHLVEFEGREYYVGALQGAKTGDKVFIAKAVLDWNEAEKPVRVYFTASGDDVAEQCIIEKALSKDTSGNYLDKRVYGIRDDATLAQREEDRAIRIASMQTSEAEPEVALEGLPKVEAPKPRMTIQLTPVSSPQIRRTVAMLDLVSRVKRELTEFEVNSLGWGELVTQQQLEEAVADFNAPKVRTPASEQAQKMA